MRMDFDLAGCEEEFKQVTSRPNMSNFFTYNKDLTGQVMDKTHVIMGRPLVEWASS